MLDINFIRENPQKVKDGVKHRGLDPSVVDRVIKVDETRRQLIAEIEKWRAERNKLGKSDIDRGKKVKEMLRRLEPDLRAIKEELKMLLCQIPNLPAEDVPFGGEKDKKILEEIGKPPRFDFIPKDHLQLGEDLGIIDVERAAKISGTRFAFLSGKAAMLELALINFAFEKLTKEGFVPVFPPMLIKKEITDGLGYWNGGGNENYYFVKDYEKMTEGKERELDLYLVGTGEHSIVPMHSGETFNKEDLPVKYVAFSGCFRREAGSYGKDTKGILRVHQFDKVEMVCFVRPEESKKEHERMLSYSKHLMSELGLPFRIVVLASGDMGFPSAKTYDIETWIPSQKKYRETHSISTTTEYQARRLNIKYRGKEDKGYVHILNGTVFAIGRTILAILENFQQKDGSVLVPKVLQKYTGFTKISPKK